VQLGLLTLTFSVASLLQPVIGIYTDSGRCLLDRRGMGATLVGLIVWDLRVTWLLRRWR
jgi:hypothetical protein